MSTEIIQFNLYDRSHCHYQVSNNPKVVTRFCATCSEYAKQLQERVEVVRKMRQDEEQHPGSTGKSLQAIDAAIVEFQFFADRVREIAGKEQTYLVHLKQMHEDVVNCINIFNEHAQAAGIAEGTTDATQLTDEQDGKRVAMQVVSGVLENLHKEVHQAV